MFFPSGNILSTKHFLVFSNISHNIYEFKKNYFHHLFLNCLYKIFNYCRLKMQKCKTFSKVIFYFQTIVHLCEGKIFNNYSSSQRLFSHITALQFLCFKGSQKKNLPPLITSVFEAEYFVPVFYSYPFSLHCKAENGIIRYMYLLYFY